MKIIMVPALLAVLGAAGASEMGLLDGRLAEIFPQDEAKRIALGQCEIESGAFDRFEAAARDACYRRTTGSQFTELSHTTPAPNQLDLRAAAGRGTVGLVTR
jgi:hypothetical protein